jgi:hypothetical protein
MRRFGEPEIDLFGVASGANVSLGEHYLISEYFDKNDDCISRADWAFENIPFTGTLMLDMEDSLLLSDALKAYIFGLYALVIIAADAFCERHVVDSVESREETKKAKRGFWHMTKFAREQGVIAPFLLDRLERLHKIRNTLCHDKEGDPSRIDQRSLHDSRHYLLLMKEDAKEALCVMYGLAGSQQRNFPRWSIPGVGIVDRLRLNYAKRKKKPRR